MASPEGPLPAGAPHLARGGRRLPPAKQATVRALRRAAASSLQKSRSEGCLGGPAVWPLLLRCCELGRSWPHISDKAPAPAPGPGGPPGASKRKAGARGPAVSTAAPCPRPCRDGPCRRPLGPPGLLRAQLCRSAPENIGDESRASPGRRPRHAGALARAQSVTGCLLRHPEGPSGQDSVAPGAHLKERTAAAGESGTGTALPPAPRQTSPVLPAPQSGASCLRGVCRPRTLNCTGGPREPLSEGLGLDDQLGRDSRPSPGPSLPAAELGSLGSQEVPLPAKCKSGHSPESRPGEPQGAGPAPEAAGNQKHLGAVAAVEAGNQTSDDTAKRVLPKRSKPPAGAGFPHPSGNSGSQACKTEGARCSAGSAPKTTPKSSAAHAPKEAEDAICLDLKGTGSTWQGFSQRTSAAACPPSSRRAGCDQGPEGAASPWARALRRAPGADAAPRGRCALIILVEQKGLQATRRGARALPESRSCEFLEERPPSPRGAGAAPPGPPAAGTPLTRSPGGDGETLAQGAHAARGREDACSQEPAGGVLTPEGPVEDKPPGRRQGSGTGAVARAAALAPWDTRRARAGARGGGEGEGGVAPAASPRADPLHQASQEPEPLQLGACALGAEGEPERSADRPTPVASGLGASTRDPAPTHHVHALEAPQVVQQSPGQGAAGRVGGGDTETLRDPSCSRLSPEGRDAKTPRIPEKRLRARLAIAHRTFTSFFESKVVDKENTYGSSPGSPQDPKGCGRRLQSSWRALLRSKAAGGPNGPSLARLGPESHLPLGLAPGTDSHCEEQPGGQESPAVRGHGAPPPSPCSGGCPNSRSESEPPIHCASPLVMGRHLCAGIFPGKPCLMSPTGPSAQQLRADGAGPSPSACCLAYGSPGMPSKPLGPKPHSPRPRAPRADLRHPGTGSAGSMVFLGSYRGVDSSPEAPEMPRTPQAGTSHLCSLQTLDQEDQREDSWERRLSTVPSLGDLPGSERWSKRTGTPPGPRSPPSRSHPFSQSAPTGLNRLGQPERRPDPAIPDGGLDAAVHADKTGSEEDLYEDVHGSGHHYSHPGGGGEQLAINELISDGGVVCAEALWDHVTMDDQELGFQAGDVVEVMDATHREWWWGRVAGGEGWFPAGFVRLRVNQDEPADDEALRAGVGGAEDGTAGAQSSVRDQMRTNVIREILSTERDYIKHLRDICEGYIRQCRKRADMFSEEQLRTIFGNIEDIYRCHAAFVKALEQRFNREHPHLSELGACFLEHQAHFQIYSDYCNNHPDACAELSRLARLSKYTYFFEACRLLQRMIDISLDGFLLTPVQKICQYPLQLAELLKYTHPQHRDFKDVEAALDAMKKVARLINERKRRLENIDKIAQWQSSVEGWEGEDLLARSSELIHSGELALVTLVPAKSQQRVFFLFDHQLIYCKKDLLRRDVLYYKGRVDLGGLEVEDVEDCKDRDLHVSVKNAFRLRCSATGESHLLCARKPEQKQRWLQAFARERQQVRLDQETGFSITELQRRQAMLKANKLQAAGKPKALGRPYYLMRQKPPALPASVPQPQVLVLAEPKRKPSTFWHSLSRLAPFRK